VTFLVIITGGLYNHFLRFCKNNVRLLLFELLNCCFCYFSIFEEDYTVFYSSGSGSIFNNFGRV
jgi:hypothetical protein